MRKSRFSIIELMTVILIILLLLSLLAPTFFKLKTNARTSICKGQLRQIGILISYYIADNNGYLPNDDYFNRNTAPYPIVINDLGSLNDTGFYAYWQGHLSPYLSLKLPQGFRRAVSGQIVPESAGFKAEIQPIPVPAKDIYKDGWIVLEDALYKGGHDDYKVFICPQIHGFTTDIDVMNKKLGLRIPRILEIMYKYGWTGIPTTYIANSIYFGKNGYYDAKVDSKRVDQIADISQKIMIVEGGGAIPDDYSSSPYFFPNNNYAGSNSGGLIANFDRGDEANQKLNFVHDLQKEFWILGGKNINTWGFTRFGDCSDLARKFNDAFADKAMMIHGPGYSSGFHMSYSLVSYTYPEGGNIFKSFFANNPYVGTSTLNPIGAWDAYIDGKQDDYNYLVGEMNILFGDGAVATKNNAWLCNNRQKLADSWH